MNPARSAPDHRVPVLLAQNQKLKLPETQRRPSALGIAGAAGFVRAAHIACRAARRSKSHAPAALAGLGSLTTPSTPLGRLKPSESGTL